MSIIPGKNTITQKSLSIISFSLFFAWLLAFPFEGQVLYAIAENANADGAYLSLFVVFVHFTGLFTGGFIVRRQAAARITMVTASVLCISGSMVFFLPYSVLWYVSIVLISYFAGLYVSGWGFYFKSYTSSENRLKTAADVLIYSNIVMIVINIITVYTTAYIGLSLSIVTLIIALFVTLKLEPVPGRRGMPRTHYNISEPLVFLCSFILVITINSGLMYQVVNPAYAHLEVLTSYYWAVPYIAALLLLRNLTDRFNIAYGFYIAMGMIGLSYILFMLLDRSAKSYLLIDTLMLGAFGVCDLFWWSILGNFLDYTNNPAKVLGAGLSMNVLGILLGGYIGNAINSTETPYFTASVVALFVIFVVMIMFPILNNQLVRLLKSHSFLVKFTDMDEREQDETLERFKKNKKLTDKETEIVRFLLAGYTYRAISESLFITQNTVKFHIKNIYQKLQISSKMELIKTFLSLKNQ